jgi:hypothetical protein
VSLLDRIDKKAIGDAGRKSEKRLTKDMGMKALPSSGALPGFKSDGIYRNHFRVEMKSAKTKAIKLERDWLAKISQEAISHGQEPALTISFVTEEGKPAMQLNPEWVAIPRHVFEELVQSNACEGCGAPHPTSCACG